MRPQVEHLIAPARLMLPVRSLILVLQTGHWMVSSSSSKTLCMGDILRLWFSFWTHPTPSGSPLPATVQNVAKKPSYRNERTPVPSQYACRRQHALDCMLTAAAVPAETMKAAQRYESFGITT